jgi:hypothetical protein
MKVKSIIALSLLAVISCHSEQSRKVRPKIRINGKAITSTNMPPPKGIAPSKFEGVDPVSVNKETIRKNKSKPRKKRISSDEAIFLSKKVIGNFYYSKSDPIDVVYTNNLCIVSFPNKKIKNTRTDKYASEVFLDAKTGIILKIRFGSIVWMNPVDFKRKRERVRVSA